MNHTLFDSFFQNRARSFLLESIDQALKEDGRDLTSEGLFTQDDRLKARIVAKEEAVVAGLPIIALVFERLGVLKETVVDCLVKDGSSVASGTELARIDGPAAAVLKAERVVLNFLCHLCGIATLTRRYAALLENTKTRLLDTRKTLPGLRYPEKYAVRLGGGFNHRITLEEMLMLKDNHVDRMGGIRVAVERLRSRYSPCPPIEVECRTLEHVQEAVQSRADRIMLDNMNDDDIVQALGVIPETIETEVSGNVTMDSIRRIALLGPDYISVGRITHSAPSVDLSLQYITPPNE
ncbi:MAG: carboxylating nicotinate-nucleotide diphosphorylase [Desulfovibrionales bacterium]